MIHMMTDICHLTHHAEHIKAQVDRTASPWDANFFFFFVKLFPFILDYVFF